MKKLIVLFSMMFFIMSSALAQKGIQAAGVHLSYGTEISSIGLGVKYQYNITDNIRLEPSINYFFENDGVDQFDVNATAHYLLPIQSNMRFYPLAGLTYTTLREDQRKDPVFDGAEVTHNKFGAETTYNKFGMNLGGGAEFDITDELMVNFEIKYQLISDFGQAIFSLGIAYMF